MRGIGYLRLVAGVLALWLAAASGTARAELRDGLAVAYGAPAAPPLQLRDLSAARVRLADYRGRVVLVNFWATWCPPCIEELPGIARLWDALNPQGLEVLAVNLGEEAARVQRFLDGFEPTLRFPVLLDSDGEAFQTWNARGLPKTYVVDKTGRVRYTAEGGRRMDSAHIMGLLRDLMSR